MKANRRWGTRLFWGAIFLIDVYFFVLAWKYGVFKGVW